MELCGQASKQDMHLTHLAVSMTAGCLRSQAIAPLGQALKHRPHFLQSSGSTQNFRSGMQRLEGHFLSRMCASYSSRK